MSAMSISFLSLELQQVQAFRKLIPSQPKRQTATFFILSLTVVIGAQWLCGDGWEFFLYFMFSQLLSIHIKERTMGFKIRNLFKDNEYIHLQFQNGKRLYSLKAFLELFFFSKI